MLPLQQSAPRTLCKTIIQTAIISASFFGPHNFSPFASNERSRDSALNLRFAEIFVRLSTFQHLLLISFNTKTFQFKMTTASQPLPDIAESLERHNAAFTTLLSLIPAQYYIAVDPEMVSWSVKYHHLADADGLLGR